LGRLSIGRSKVGIVSEAASSKRVTQTVEGSRLWGLPRGAIKPRWSGPETEQGENTIPSSSAHKFRDGCLQVCIRRNQGDRGTYYTAMPIRSYEKGDDTWKETDSLTGDDLLAMAQLLREAYAWIKIQKKADAAGLSRPSA
jgi:hypothetical protein